MLKAAGEARKRKLSKCCGTASFAMSRDVVGDYEVMYGDKSVKEKYEKKHVKQTSLKTLVGALRTCQQIKRTIMSFDKLRMVMLPEHAKQLRDSSKGKHDSNGNALNYDEALVCWLLEKTYKKRSDLPAPSHPAHSENETGDERARRRDNEQWVHMPADLPATARPDGSDETVEERATRRDFESQESMERRSDDESSDEEEEYPVEELEKELEVQMAKLSEQNGQGKKEKWMDISKVETKEAWEVEKDFAANHDGRQLVDNIELFSRGFNFPPRPKGESTKKKKKKESKKKPVKPDPNIVRDLEDEKERILSTTAFPAEDAPKTDIFSLSKEDRWRLLGTWQEKLAEQKREQLDRYWREYMKACKEAEAADDVTRATVLMNAQVVGATTTGSARRRDMIAQLGPKIIVVEEAAQVLEAHVLASIVPSVQHAIFIGDHQQLRPSTAVHSLATDGKMEISLFERLVKNGYPFRTRGLQHRMLTPLTQHIVRPFFYNALQDSPSVREYPDIRGMGSNLFFWAHNVSESTVSDSKSRKNVVEAEMCRDLVHYVFMQGQYSASQITVIGMYGAQVKAIKELMKNVGGQVAHVAVETVDSFQGKENRVMILSLVRSNTGGIGFLKTANRITVALTRAQHAMLVIGNFADIMEHSGMWNGIVTRPAFNPVVCWHTSPTELKSGLLDNLTYGPAKQLCKEMAIKVPKSHSKGSMITDVRAHLIANPHLQKRFCDAMRPDIALAIVDREYSPTRALLSAKMRIANRSLYNIAVKIKGNMCDVDDYDLHRVIPSHGQYELTVKMKAREASFTNYRGHEGGSRVRPWLQMKFIDTEEDCRCAGMCLVHGPKAWRDFKGLYSVDANTVSFN